VKIELRKMEDSFLYWDPDENDCIGRDYCVLTRGDVIGYTNQRPFPESDTYKQADMIFDLCTYKGAYITACSRYQAEYIRDLILEAMEGRMK
jgi:hypothetical protein